MCVFLITERETPMLDVMFGVLLGGRNIIIQCHHGLPFSILGLFITITHNVKLSAVVGILIAALLVCGLMSGEAPKQTQ
jgi:hypothetical protein